MNCSVKLVVTGVMLAAPVLLSVQSAYCLSNIDSQVKTVQKADTAKVKTEQKADTTKVKKARFLRAIKIDGGGNIDDVSNRGFVSSGMNLMRRVDIDFTYDYVAAKNVKEEHLKKEAKKKEKRLLIANVQYTVWRNTVCGISYDSDGEIGLYSTLVKGGFKKQFSNGLYVDGFVGLKVGKIEFKKEKEDVLGGSIKYKLPRSYTNNFLGFDLKAFYRLPRKYAKSGMFEGPWIGGFNSAVTFPVTKNVRMGVDYNVRRDYLPGLDMGLIRKAMSFKLSYEIKDDTKKKKSK